MVLSPPPPLLRRHRRPFIYALFSLAVHSIACFATQTKEVSAFQDLPPRRRFSQQPRQNCKYPASTKQYSSSSLAISKAVSHESKDGNKLSANQLKWNEQLEELRSYKDKHGNCNVPQRSRPLGTWVNRQRREYAKRNTGEKSSMTDERIHALEELGSFEWNHYEAAWREKFDDLMQFKAQHGHCNVPQSLGSLGDWTKIQRIEYNKMVQGKESKMTTDKADMLSQNGFVFDPHQVIFDEKLAELRRFKETHGHIEVGTINGDLSEWYYDQRKRYMKWLQGDSTALSDERREALEKLGFNSDIFSAHKSSRRTRVKWEDRLAELEGYSQENGHVMVPTSRGPLGRWVDTQRCEMVKRKRGFPSKLTDERIQQLNYLGMIWDMNEYRFDVKIAELKRYKIKHGHVNVPMSAGKLGVWVLRLRSHYLLKQRGEPSSLTDDRIEQLNELEFAWEWGKDVASQNNEKWMDNFAHLEAYRQEHGTFRVSASHTDKTFVMWCARQRTQYKKYCRGELKKVSPILRERMRMLKTIGFD